MAKNKGILSCQCNLEPVLLVAYKMSKLERLLVNLIFQHLEINVRKDKYMKKYSEILNSGQPF